MSGPTKIYLVVVAVLCMTWMGVSTFVAAEDLGPNYMTNPDELLGNSGRFTAVLRGRVDVRNAEGEPVAPPEGALVVDVRAQDAAGTLAVRRIGTVQPDGVFEVLSLPHGFATVAVQLGGGETIWECEDIVVGGVGILDPRIDPIDLGTELFFFDLEVRGPSGAPATQGQLAWRRVDTASAGDEMAFDGLAQIDASGRAKFFSSVAVLDAVCMVPGARTELFEELYLDSPIDLGPGISIDLIAAGELPDPRRWLLRAVLVPEDLVPKIQLKQQGFDEPSTSIFAELDATTGRVLIPVARGGRYRLTWDVLRPRPQRSDTIRLSESEVIEVPAEPGVHQVESTFPMAAFLRKASRR